MSAESQANLSSIFSFWKALISFLAPGFAHNRVKQEAARCIANMAMHEEIKAMLVDRGALGYLISLSKSGVGLAKMYAVSVLSGSRSQCA